LLFDVTICGANSEEKIISSAEEIAAFWENSLSNKLNIVIYNPEMHYWHVNRIVLVNQSFDFDIKKTDSIVTPYQLIIRLSFNRWHNRLSPNANSDYEYENRIRGFKTADDALANTGNSDFDEAKYSYVEKISRQMTIIYVLKKKAWILEDGNDLFETYIGQHISDMNNAHLFKNVLSVPIK
jgi:hypothetical protein